MPKKKTKEEFIKDARKVHGDKYDYSKVEYVGSKIKVCIICPKHGEFWQTPSHHFEGKGCPKCSGNYIPTTEEWIENARNVHGDKYDYSKVHYVNNATKVCINCPIHGGFEQTPNNHLAGQGCPTCGKCIPTKEEWIAEARKVHGNKYDYSKAYYVNSRTKVCIICPEHGEFWQTPHKHLQGRGCSTCGVIKIGDKNRLSLSNFIKRANKVHGDKYDYSKVEYVNCATKVCIICPKHGEFWQTPSSHLSGCGCPKCSLEKQTSDKEEFIKKSRKVHGDKYGYSKVEYVNVNTKIHIICPEHGEFWQVPTNHLSGQGCPTCGIEKNAKNQALSTKEFIKKAKKVHKDKYDYSKVDYVNSVTKVCIICPEHGEFEQRSSNHLRGDGCQTCNLSHLERSVMNYLDEVGITYDYQKRFDWLGRQSLDFYLPDYNVGIECQGRQHFFPVECFGGDKEFKKVLERDKRKKTLCEKHGVKLLYFGNVPNYDTFLGEMVHDDVQYLIDYLNEHKIDRDKPTTE